MDHDPNPPARKQEQQQQALEAAVDHFLQHHDRFPSPAQTRHELRFRTPPSMFGDRQQLPALEPEIVDAQVIAHSVFTMRTTLADEAAREAFPLIPDALPRLELAETFEFMVSSLAQREPGHHPQLLLPRPVYEPAYYDPYYGRLNCLGPYLKRMFPAEDGGVDPNEVHVQQPADAREEVDFSMTEPNMHRLVPTAAAAEGLDRISSTSSTEPDGTVNLSSRQTSVTTPECSNAEEGSGSETRSKRKTRQSEKAKAAVTTPKTIAKTKSNAKSKSKSKTKLESQNGKKKKKQRVAVHKFSFDYRTVTPENDAPMEEVPAVASSSAVQEFDPYFHLPPAERREFFATGKRPEPAPKAAASLTSTVRLVKIDKPSSPTSAESKDVVNEGSLSYHKAILICRDIQFYIPYNRMLAELREIESDWTGLDVNDPELRALGLVGEIDRAWEHWQFLCRASEFKGHAEFDHVLACSAHLTRGYRVKLKGVRYTDAECRRLNPKLKPEVLKDILAQLWTETEDEIIVIMSPIKQLYGTFKRKESQVARAPNGFFFFREYVQACLKDYKNPKLVGDFGSFVSTLAGNLWHKIQDQHPLFTAFSQVNSRLHALMNPGYKFCKSPAKMGIVRPHVSKSRHDSKKRRSTASV